MDFFNNSRQSIKSLRAAYAAALAEASRLHALTINQTFSIVAPGQLVACVSLPNASSLAGECPFGQDALDVYAIIRANAENALERAREGVEEFGDEAGAFFDAAADAAANFFAFLQGVRNAVNNNIVQVSFNDDVRRLRIMLWCLCIFWSHLPVIPLISFSLVLLFVHFYSSSMEKLAPGWLDLLYNDALFVAPNPTFPSLIGILSNVDAPPGLEAIFGDAAQALAAFQEQLAA